MRQPLTSPPDPSPTRRGGARSFSSESVTRAVKSLTWDQVTAWRLARHGLAPRVGFQDAMRRIIGVQAQVMSAAELALWARVDGLRPADVQAALWQERSLVKTWAMRGIRPTRRDPLARPPARSSPALRTIDNSARRRGEISPRGLATHAA